MTIVGVENQIKNNYFGKLLLHTGEIMEGVLQRGLKVLSPIKILSFGGAGWPNLAVKSCHALSMPF